MSKTSVNLSNRIFFTIDHWDGSAYVGELDQTRDDDGKLEQKKLVTFTKDELAVLISVCHRIADVQNRSE